MAPIIMVVAGCTALMDGAQGTAWFTDLLT